MILRIVGIIALLTAAAAVARAQYVSSDTYTRYELLAPDSHSFKIYYEVTETRAGARYHFNIIRPGSTATDESVVDLATGRPLEFEVVSGKDAGGAGERLDPEARYIRVRLAHPVPERGEYRIAITKTYTDARSYFTEGDAVVFRRQLTIPRNSVVLPAGYEIVSTSMATQVIPERDGRLKLAFVNAGSGGPLEVAIRARRRAE